MRNVKFRVWNIEENKFVDKRISDSFAIFTLECVNDNSMYRNMEYTGLKDKNGNEIYEDDILSIHLDNEIYLSLVMLRYACWVIYHPHRIDMNTGERDYINFGWWVSHDNIEIIGNIYENPDLLQNGT